MAHVLLPCDVPSWPDVQRQLSELKFAHSPEQLVADMQRIHDLCCVGLDPEETSREEVSLDTLKKFLKISLTAEQRLRFFEMTLPFLISSALNLKQDKPEGGFLYSLQQQPGVFPLDRQFINSLLANAFFSTFPKRNFRTHPTLQDFNFADLFQHLESPAQADKLKKLLNYFYCALQAEPEGTVYFSRKVTPSEGLMSMPEWMCSDCPLCPLMVRTRGIMEDAEPILLKAYPCSAKIGGDVLRDGNNMECSAFTNAPELLAALAFAESLGDNETLTVDGILPMEHMPQAEDEPSLSPYETSIALVDFKDHTFKPGVQFEDSSLLRELNKCLLAFRQTIDARRPSPVGRSSSSSAGLDGGFQSFPSSINSSSQNSVYVTDSADQQSDDAGTENKAHNPPQQATTPCHKAKKAVKADIEAQPARKPIGENKARKTVLDASKESSTVVPTPPVLTATSLLPPSQKVPNCCQKEDVRSKATVPELPALRKSSRRSFNSSSSKGSFEKRRLSYEKILCALPPPAASTPPLLTQAVLCAQRHPSPRPERRGSSGTGQSGMVFRPVTPSPTGSRRSSFRPLLESMPAIDPRKEIHELSCREPIPLPACSFLSLADAKKGCSPQPSTVPLHPQLFQEKHTLSSSPVSSPRFRSSFGNPEDNEPPGRPLCLDLPVSKASRPEAPGNIDIPQSSPLSSPSPTANGCRRSLSASSTPYGSPEAELWPRTPHQKTTEDEHDFRTAEESLSEERRRVVRVSSLRRSFPGTTRPVQRALCSIIEATTTIAPSWP